VEHGRYVDAIQRRIMELGGVAEQALAQDEDEELRAQRLIDLIRDDIEASLADLERYRGIAAIMREQDASSSSLMAEMAVAVERNVGELTDMLAGLPLSDVSAPAHH
jgi:hypothetical protein